MKKFLSLTVLVLTAFISFSQKVENVDFNFVDEKIVIFYDLVDCESKYRYEVEIKFTDDRGNTLIPRVLNGDYGRVTCGKNKRVEWNPFQEMSSFEGNYKVTVNIVNVYDRIGKPVIASSNEYKPKKPFDISAYTKFVRIKEYYDPVNSISLGLSLGYYFFYTNAIIGADVGYSNASNIYGTYNPKIDLSFFLGTTPKFLNNKHLSFGLMVNPISYIDENEDNKYGPAFGLYGCFEFWRIKIAPGIAYYFYENINYGEKYGLIPLFASIKLRLN